MKDAIPLRCHRASRRPWSSALGCGSVAADQEGHGLAAGDTLLFLFGWRDAVPAQLPLELRARDVALGAVDDLAEQVLVPATHPVELAFHLLHVDPRSGQLRA